jgi:Flp pilus assembly protein TadD
VCGPPGYHRPIRTVAASHLRILLAAACVAGLLWMLAVARQEQRLVDADDALGAGHPARAAQLAGAASGSSVGGRAARTLAAAALQQGNLAEAERQIARAVRLAPNDWSLHRDHAVLLQRLGDRSEARDELRRALRLNPRIDAPPGFTLADTSSEP